jgi:signal transduction histidine kinase
MPDVIIYFGPLELLGVAAALTALTAGLVLAVQRQRWAGRRRRLLDGLPYPALLFDRDRLIFRNTSAEEWRESLDILAMVADSRRSGQNIVRTVPAVEGQSFQARAVRLSTDETLVLLEDLAAAQRQQSLGWLASRRIIADEAKRLTQLVDNLLTLTRLESPSFALEHGPLSFAALLEEAILQISDLAEERRLAISLNAEPGLPRIRGDRARLKQVVLNLLDNALKYTPPGGSITVSLKADRAASRIVCSIQDTGEGIPADDLPHVFDKLYRARRPRGRPVEGSGLGLTIVQQIVQAHGGEIKADSALGKGSTFIFTLPAL